MIGKIHSFFAGGTVDGPGIRFVIFMKGCPLRCLYCHNPDTWNQDGAECYEVDDVVSQALRYKGYFNNGGGVTVSGGEPLIQIDFVIELFKKLKKYNVHTALDTSGIIFDKDNLELKAKFDELIKYTDLVLLDIKHIDNDEHIKLTGKSNKNVLEFAKYLSNNKINVWIRHVLVPDITLNDNYLTKLKEFIDTLSNVSKIEVLPYHTMGIVKYKNLGIPYRLEGVRTPTKEEVKHAKYLLGVIKDVA
ncbi:MAG: pyruvate formate lyase-activating protein [Acholeplasmatales bacterium]|nr:pyruvate formate lyase-activating protein [Acholeplasmatales bacterium]